MRKPVRKILLGLVLLAMGCSSQQSSGVDPKSRLKDYIAKSFSVSKAEDRKALMEFLTGDARERLSLWSDDQFLKAFVDQKRKFIKLSFKDSKNSSDTETSITYELTFGDQTKGTKAMVTQKKICTLVQENGIWMIRDVRSLKEVVEYTDELSLP